MIPFYITKKVFEFAAQVHFFLPLLLQKIISILSQFWLDENPLIFQNHENKTEMQKVPFFLRSGVECVDIDLAVLSFRSICIGSFILFSIHNHKAID